ncbi:MAG: UDP-N-acetylglucosamine 2-epimerase (non-hydrolyzing) [Elusimicrobia bacterium]|nr:UDP-N-acetylglucosamine 2-epimerase (non-hydrolyzing) [Elusimicrobiota bacterium]
MKILHVVGARPNFMKSAPLMRAFAAAGIRQSLVHTGQHYDPRMSEVFIEELGLPAPDVDLEVGSGSHAEQTARVMERLEPILLDARPDWLVVVGDVNSTLAAALVAAKMQVRVAHVEAGLRSFDRTMPEEINRVLTDQIADLCLASEEQADTNLRREGIAPERIRFVGNLMIDTLVRLLPLAQRRPVLTDLGPAKGDYALVTMHRPANVDDPGALREIVSALSELAREMRVVFPVHPRTMAALERTDLRAGLGACEVLAPLGYLDFLALQHSAALVITDSGGIQEETTYLGVPCLTVRPNTERPVTISHGTNRLVERTVASILAAAREARVCPPVDRMPPPLWDGHAAERAAAEILSWRPA